MPSIKEYNRKIGSLKNTTKITKTMKMVSASKLRRAQDAQKDAADYSREVNELIYQIAGGVDQSMHPLLVPSDEVKKVLVVVYTSDKGLCGGFNNNLSRYLRSWLKERRAEGLEVQLAFAGKRGHTFFSRDQIYKNYEGVTAKPDPIDAARIADDLEEAFVHHEFDQVFLLYNHFLSPLSQVPTMDLLLPLSPEEFIQEGQQGEVKKRDPEDFIAEPNIEYLVKLLIPRLVNFKIHYAMLENSAGEHGARMTAMDNATTNAMTLIDDFTLLRNRARQAAITTELIEIISGAEAL